MRHNFKEGDALRPAHKDYEASYKSQSGDDFKWLEKHPEVEIHCGGDYNGSDSGLIYIKFIGSGGYEISYSALASDFRLKRKPTIVLLED